MPNRLATESSPYLRLHAANPVDWLPWGEEAFARARSLDRPIFLSIGYFTCHWCHVMERESFADPACAEILNREFVSIKVDREERPDVDRLYMSYVQAATGGGGWPLSAFLTPDLRPFYGGTYFPPRDGHGLPGFPRLLLALADAWRTQRDRVLASAGDARAMLESFARLPTPDAEPAIEARLLGSVWPRLASELHASFDHAHGGFGGAPKFPRPSALTFLLRHFAADPAARRSSLDIVLATLRAMAQGGIHDHLGGGFHRYATDAAWRVPHFEKMLYDQAQLVISYLDAWQITGEDEFAHVARSTCDFVLAEMTSPEGGFYSAQDADSPIPVSHRRPGGPAEGEGAYYLWTRSEIFDLLPPAAAEAFCAQCGVTEAGNVPEPLDPHGEFTGKNILCAASPIAPETRARLYAARRLRPRPPTDTKILTAWNGLMISALALAAARLEEPRYLQAAQAAARHLHNAPGDVLQRTPGIPAFAEDYALLIQGLLDLHQADFDPRWNDWARQLQLAMDARFAAPEGGYYATVASSELLLRLRDEYDGAEPSPNSVALANLLRLDARDQARSLLASFAQRLEQAPQALPAMAAELAIAAAPPRHVQITGEPEAADTQALLRVVRRRFLPGVAIQFQPSASPAAAALCDNRVCLPPVSAPEALSRSL